ENFLYDVGENGALMRGTRNAYLGMYYLRVNGANYIGDIDHLSPDGRETRRAPFIEQGSGLEVRRHFYVSKTQNFARFSEILHNPTDAPITVDVEIYGKLGAKSHTTALVDQAHFLITDDRTDNVSGIIPVLLHYHSQVNHPVTATHTTHNNQLSWVYSDVTIPAQSEARIIYFVAQTTDVNVAKQVATDIYINPTALYENIDESAQLLNFEPQQPISRENEEISDLSKAPFLNLGELRTGTLEEKDYWSFKRMATPADAYALTLEADETVTIRMSARFNAYLYLFQDMKAETIVAANDDRGAKTTHAEIVFTAIEDGTYYIEATAHNRREYGEYTLEILSGAVNQPPTAYPFDFTATTLIFPATVTLTDFNTDKESDIVERCWHFDDGSDVTCESSNTVTHTYTEAGQYNVGLTLRDNDGAYSYHNEQISIASPPEGIVLRLSNIVSEELMPSDGYSQIRFYVFADRYRISSITAGQELVIDMISDDFDSYLYLYDRFNQPLAQDNNSGGGTHARLRYTPQHYDDLWIEATSFKDNTQGKYHLSLKSAENSISVEIPIAFSPALNNPLQYQFIARLPDSFKATSLHWDFGDKTETVKTNKPILSHTYAQRGEMTVTVTAINDKNQRLTGKQRLIVNNKITAPKASFTAHPLFGEKPLRVFFRNDSVPSSHDEPLNYVWHFGDGNLSSDSNPAHSFTKAGTYHITLEAFSSQERASYTLPITVIDHDDTALPITGKVRELPQVLMAGFDPILIDFLDTHVKIFALVRAGKTPIKTVRF
ncbi:PKD domain-containing protein, partial [Candidatus Marithioploca araucensis]|nr:PKD domain-containing protein [Candidatus Marithioploca araucensis]